MKNAYVLLAVLAILPGVLISSLTTAQEKQEKEIRIKIITEADGEVQRIDTLVYVYNDSLKVRWHFPECEKMDSIREEVHRHMEEFNREQREKFNEQMERVRERMERMYPEMERMRDSLRKARIEVIIPKLHHLDFLQKHELDIHMKQFDSLHRKMIIRMDSLGPHHFNIDVDMDFDLDSILEESRIHMKVLDSLNIPAIIPWITIQRPMRESMRYMPIFMIEEDFDDGEVTDSRVEFKDGKVMIIKTDKNGKVRKVIIMSHDGETLDVKENDDAREFMTEDGEKVSFFEVKNNTGPYPI